MEGLGHDDDVVVVAAGEEDNCNCGHDIDDFFICFLFVASTKLGRRLTFDLPAAGALTIF